MSRALPTMAAVAVAGALGSLCRAWLEALFPAPGTGVPWATFAANVSGSLALGVLSALVLHRHTPAWVRPAIGTGFLGGFTTFSAYVVGAEVMLRSGAPGAALGYALLTPVLCVAAAATGASIPPRVRREHRTAGAR